MAPGPAVVPGRARKQLPKQVHGFVKFVADALLAGDQNAAELLLERKTREHTGISSNAFYHSLIHACAESGSPEAAGWCAMKMIHAGLKPNTVTFNTLIDACAKVGNVSLATRWWHLMTQTGLAPNSITYNTMINVCAKSGDAWLAESWMQRMCAADIAPCIVSWSTLINAFAKIGKVGKAEALFRKMNSTGVAADEVIYNSMIDACAKAGDPVKAEYWLVQMLERGVRADRRTFNSLINAAAKAGQLERAEQWLRQMEMAGCKTDMVTFGSVIHAAARVGNVQRAEHWIEEMAIRGLTPNLRVINTLLHACAHGGDRVQASKWHQRILDARLTPNDITYNCMINVHAKSGDLATAEKWLRMMVAEGFHPDHVTFFTLLRACETLPNCGDAREVLQWTFGAMINAYREIGCSQGVRRWALAMSKVGFKPTSHLRNKILQVCPDFQERALAPRTGRLSSNARSPLDKAVGLDGAFSHKGQPGECAIEEGVSEWSRRLGAALGKPPTGGPKAGQGPPRRPARAAATAGAAQPAPPGRVDAPAVTPTEETAWARAAQVYQGPWKLDMGALASAGLTTANVPGPPWPHQEFMSEQLRGHHSLHHQEVPELLSIQRISL